MLAMLLRMLLSLTMLWMLKQAQMLLLIVKIHLMVQMLLRL
jgi:hypothetical protein